MQADYSDTPFAQSNQGRYSPETPNGAEGASAPRGARLHGESDANYLEGVSMSTTPPPVRVRTQKKSGPSSGGIVKLVVLGVILLVVLIFVLSNTGKVPMSFLFWDFGFRLWALFVITLVAGILLGMLGSTLLRRRRRQDLRRRANSA